MSTANQNSSITFKIHIYVFTHVNYLAICRRKRREISRTGLPLVWSAKMVSYEYFLLHPKLIGTGLLCYIFFTFLLQIPFAKDPLSFMPSFLQIIFVSGPLYCNSFLFLVLFSTNPLCFMSSLFNVLFSTDQPCLMSSFLKIIFSKDHLSFWFS